MNIFEEINSWSADELLSRISLQRANDNKSWVCPICGNGSNGDPRHGGGDGINVIPRTSPVRWKCHRCGKNFSNFDLAAASFGIDAEHSPAEAAKRLKDEFGLADDRDFSSSRKQSARAGAANYRVGNSESAGTMDEKKSASTSKPKNYAKFYHYCRGNLKSFVDSQGGKWRGLTYETLAKYGVGFMAKFGKDKTSHVIIPYDDYHYFARAVEGKGRSRYGEGAGLYEPEPIDVNKPIIIVEGEIDALSLCQACGEYFNYVATSSAANTYKAVNELEKRFADAERKPSCIVVFDDDNPSNDPNEDNTGKGKSKELVKMLQGKDYPAVSFFFTDTTSANKKVDANDLLQRGELCEQFFHKVDLVGVDIDEQVAAIAEAKAHRLEVKAREVAALETVQRAEDNRRGITDFPMAEYFSQHFWADVTLGEKYAERRTGFDNLDGTGKFEREGQKIFFLPGLYILGGTPGAGKTSFAWQLLNQLAVQGETCIFCSYEMSRAELYSKSVASAVYRRNSELSKGLNLSSANIRRGAGRNDDEVNQVVAEFAATTANFRVFELSNVPVTELIKRLKPIVSSSDKASVIVVDYLQIIPPTTSKATAKEKVDDVMLRLKNFQRATNTTLIVISALNRASKQSKEPELDAFRESSSIEYSCDVALALTTDKDDDIKKMPRPTKLICRKNRYGGRFDDVYFNYHCRFDYFEPCTEQDYGGDDDDNQSNRIKGKRVHKSQVPFD